MEFVSRYFNIPRESFFLFGPRGTGKSTFVKAIFGKGLYVDLLLPDIFRNYTARPERLRELVLGNPDKEIIVIDEIQKIPDLLGVIHSLIEEKSRLQFVMTGSSARKLKRTGVNLLAGRALVRNMHGFTASELGADFDFEKALLYGTIPLIWNSSEPMDKLSAYIDLYLREEVQMEGLTRNIGNFSRFLEAVAFSHGAILNISNVARECQVERKVVESYIAILEDLLLAFRVPIFSKRAKRSTVAHPKFYFFDTGVFRTLRPSGPLDGSQEIEGAALEGLVAQHLRAWIDYSGKGYRLFYWRTRAGSEVDFIVYGRDLFWAIEVKNTVSVRSQDIRHLKTFKNDYPESKAMLLYRGTEKLLIDNIHIIPCDEFLHSLKPEL